MIERGGLLHQRGLFMLVIMIERDGSNNYQNAAPVAWWYTRNISVFYCVLYAGNLFNIINLFFQILDFLLLDYLLQGL